jgi:hypothetical protein
MKSYTQHDDTQHNFRALSFSVSLMLDVTYKPFMLSVVKLNFIMVSVMAPVERKGGRKSDPQD